LSLLLLLFAAAAADEEPSALLWRPLAVAAREYSLYSCFLFFLFFVKEEEVGVGEGSSMVVRRRQR